MHHFVTITDIRQFISTLPAGHRIGFVPTMGSLHEGHLSLIHHARKHCDHVFVSIFVNPTQFGPTEDFDRYPRSLDSDLKQLKQLQVDAVFTPSRHDIYPNAEQGTEIYVTHLSQLYCGASRPQFFKGVTSVCLRLFNIINPHHVFFGEKDYQQYIIIKTMIQDLFLPITIHCVPIVRETNGLAMSSRNKYLSTQHFQKASLIFQALTQAKHLFDNGQHHAKALIHSITSTITSQSDIRIDYCVCVHPQTLAQQTICQPGDRFLFAGYLDNTRLIDTLSL